MSLNFSELERLFLDRLLQVDVGLVGAVQRHLQLGDLDLQLLLDASNLGLKTGLSFNDTSIKLLNFNAGGFAAINSKNTFKQELGGLDHFGFK